MFRDSQVTSDELILQVFIDDVSDYLSDDLYDPSVISISESSLRFAVNIFHLIIAELLSTHAH